VGQNFLVSNSGEWVERTGVDWKRFIPHIEVIHQRFRQAGRCSDSFSPPLLWERGERD
jgi:hypothetical protein